ncbi:MAG: two pore domain potassium channel family protein [Deltaproteobacteria bacterium]|nr:two pore domain potassium channel family protein [Deltaproteobacteria bacterium]
MVIPSGKQYSSDSRPYLKRFLFLFIVLLLTLMLGPVLDAFPHMRILMTVFWSLVLISSVYAVSQKKRVILLAALLALPFFAEEWSSLFIVSLPALVIGKLFGALFFAFVIFHILRFIYRGREVCIEFIIAAAVVYLLIAVMWSYFYSVLEMIHPGSFNLPDNTVGLMQNRFIYFSFVTITTLGYGDITPNTSFASSLSMVEAVVGQLYMTVQVAWLVGIHVASHYEKRFRQTSREE